MGISGGPDMIQDGLVLALDASDRNSYPGSGTVWSDMSGNGNNGTLTNGPTFNTGNGGAIIFDGVNDYVNCGSSIPLARPFTINSWVYFNSLVGWQTFVGQDTSQATILASFYFQKTNDTQSISPRINNTFGIILVNTVNAEIYCYDPTVVQANTWYNYCATVSTTNILLYRNGTLVTTVNNSDTMAPITGNLVVGAGYYNNSVVDYVNARIPQVQIYNRALSATEVLQNYNAQKSRFNL